MLKRMGHLVITGASRGIGRALALELARRGHPGLVLTARDEERLTSLATELTAAGSPPQIVAGDLGSLEAARALGRRLAEVVSSGSTLVHNAGVWPVRRELNADGLERAFVVNHLGPLAMQAHLLEEARLARILVVSAGLIVKGRFDPERTPEGADFSRFRTYCSTKLCFAVTLRELAADHPELDVLILHPGVVRTDLGASPQRRARAASQISWRSPGGRSRARLRGGSRIGRLRGRAPPTTPPSPAASASPPAAG
ncbi:MAG: SDR family NAD(P)-dependent oxidoreductase [Myxococcota bacterium]